MRHEERKKQEEARNLVKKLKKERKDTKDRNRKKLQEALERNIQKLQMKETDMDIARAKMKLAKRDE